MAKDFARELEIASSLAKQAGKASLEAFLNRGALQILEKRQEDTFIVTPVTNADVEANRIICYGLKTKFPDYALLSEEVYEEDLDTAWDQAEYTWIVDPLDGTKSFIEGGKDFGVHIGLIFRGDPIIGVNYYPATDLIYWAVKRQGAWKQQGFGKKLRLLPQCIDVSRTLSFFVSESDIVANNICEKILGAIPAIEYVGSTGLRLCLVAEGSYNIYLTTGRKAGLWDFLSGEVILQEVGCFISDWDGNPIDYCQKDARLPRGVIVCGNQEIYHSIRKRLEGRSLFETQ